jgi:hypothetical protein
MPIFHFSAKIISQAARSVSFNLRSSRRVANTHIAKRTAQRVNRRSLAAQGIERLHGRARVF